VIYDLTDEIRAGMAGELGPEIIETSSAAPRSARSSRPASTARRPACSSLEGVIRKALNARITRDDVIVYQGDRSPRCGASRTMCPEVAPAWNAA
jgi:translation initiation factor IF-2